MSSDCNRPGIIVVTWCGLEGVIGSGQVGSKVLTARHTLVRPMPMRRAIS